MDKPQEKTTDTNEKPKGAFPAVPTTKILAIGRLVAPLTLEQRKAIPHERYVGRRGAGPAGETSFG